MKTVYTPVDIGLMDKEEVTSGTKVFDLVEMAANQIAHVIQQCHPNGKALFFCGPGNNGADGMATARLLSGAFDCRLLLLGEVDRLSPSSRRHLELAEEACVSVYIINTEDEMDDALVDFLPDLVVDALLGTGASRFPEGLMEQAVLRINRYSISTTVIAIDMPTGIMPGTGQVGDNWVCADQTITMQGIKPGLLMYPGAEYAGDIEVVKAFSSKYKSATERFLFDGESVLPMHRSRHSHKGSYGRLGIIAGSRGLSGAGALCARAALHSGCGLLSIAAPASTAQLYAGMIPEAMTCHLCEDDGGYGHCTADIAAILADKDALVIGPGMGKGAGVWPVVDAALQADIPMVLDADALNALAANDTSRIKNRSIIVTPHPAELARLMQADIQDILADPLAAAEGFAKEYKVVCVLKMSTTIVAAPGRTAFIASGCAAMAKGGSGDVLAGCMGGLLAAKKDLFYCACLAAYVCGKAGEAAQQKLGATYALPSDEIEALSQVFMQYE